MNRLELKCKLVRAIALLVVAATLFMPMPALGKKFRVILQLPWKHQFQFAGYYAALEKGYYQSEGLEVEIRQAEIGITPLSEVLEGRAQFGVGNSELVLHYMEGKPLVVVACILQHSPSILISKRVNNYLKPSDLLGKRIMLNESSSGMDILAMLYKAGLTRNSLEIVESSYSLNDLLSNRVDAYHAYSSNEPFFMDKFGIPYAVMKPAEFGIDFYSDCLFTSYQMASKNAEVVDKFRRATLNGWKYALRNKDELVHLIITKYNQSKTIDHLLFEARELERLIDPNMFEIGHSNSERWLRTAKILYQLGLIDHFTGIDNFIFKPKPSYYFSSEKLAVAILLAAIGLLGAYFLAIVKIFKKKKLIEELDQKIISKQQETIQFMQNQANLRISLLGDVPASNEIVGYLSDELRILSTEMEATIAKLNSLTNDPKIRTTLEQAIAVLKNRLHQRHRDLLLYGRLLELRPYQFKQVAIDDLLNDFVEITRQQCSFSEQSATAQVFTSSASYLVEADQLLVLLKSLTTFLLGSGGAASISIKAVQEDIQNVEMQLTVKYYSIPSVINNQIALLSTHNSYLRKDCISFFAAVNHINRMNSSFWIDSNEGREVQVRFRVPLIVIQEDSTAGFTSPPMQTGLSLATMIRLRSKTIALMDANREGFDLVRTMLSGCGSNLLHLQSLDMAAGVVENLLSLDLLVLTVGSYTANVDEAIDRIRGLNSNLPVVIIIGADTSGLQPETAIAKKISLLRKPFSQAQLIMAFSDALNRGVAKKN